MDHHREVFLTVVYPSVNDDNGFLINDSTKPVTVSRVLPNTPPADAGLQKGDLLIMINGHDVSNMPLNKLQSIISYCRCSPITIKVLRPSKKETHTNTNNYKDTVQNAFESALDAVSILSGDFNFDKVSKNVSSSNTVHQPPPSIDTDYVMHDEPKEERSQAELLSNVLKAQHGLKDIMTSLNELQKETTTETNVTFKGHLLESSAELNTGRSSHIGHSSPTEPSFTGHSSQPTEGYPPPSHKGHPSPLFREYPSPPIREHSSPPKGERSSPPPPIPVYNPKTPDRFLLSNKPEYQVEVKRQRHYYEQVEIDNEPIDTMKGKPIINNNNSVPLIKQDGHHVRHDNFDPLRANKGLPSHVHVWKTEHVLRWLKQLDSSFHDRYKDQFCHHDVTGHTLLHFNQSKLQSLGVTDGDDKLLLGMAIAKLRLKTEYKELEKLSNHETMALI